MVSEKNQHGLNPEKLLQSSFDAIQDGISILDTDLNILQVNTVMEEWYRHAMPLVGKKCYQAYHLRNSPCSICPTQTAIKNGEASVEIIPLVQESGQTGWLELFSYPIKDEKGQVASIVEFVRDISIRRKAEEKLLKNEARSRALVEAIPDTIFRYNKNGQYLDAEIKDESQLTGKGLALYQRGNLIGSRVADIHEPGNAEIIISGIRLALKTGGGVAIKYSYSLEGQERFFESRLVSIGSDEVVSIVREITEQKEAEEALHYQVQFENMVADISSNFVNVPADQVDNAINYALKCSGEFFEADRSYIFRFSDDVERMTNTHEWCAEGIISQMERNCDYPISDTPWWAEQIKSCEYVQVADVDALPDELETDRREFQTEQIKSFLSIPIFKGAELVGFFGFDAVRAKKSWTEQQISLLKVVAEIIASAIIKHETEEALKESEKRYRDILATIEETYYETDLAGNIIYFNEAGLRMFGGYSPEEAFNKSYRELYVEPDAAFKVYNRVFLTGKPERGLVLAMVRKDGTTFYGEISITLAKDKEGCITGFKGIGKDVTERIHNEKRLEYLSLHDQLTGIYNRTYFEAELERLNNGREYPITVISADIDGLKLVNDTLGHAAGDRLLQGCAAIFIESLRQSDILARVGGDEFSAILPRTDRKTSEKIILRIRKNIDYYNQYHKNLPLGISIGFAVGDHAEVTLQEIFKRSDDMMYKEKLVSSASSRSKIVQSLLTTLNERDYLAEGHARRLEEMCRAVGNKINLSTDQLADLTLLAQVHDLGKVGVPEHILFKTESLTEEEWEIMHSHSEKGYRIASSSADLVSISELILKHHEHWNGSGYPLGLKETEIPIECRILAIVDAFDAMISKRPYNTIKSTDEAIKELEDKAGICYDPELVPVFIEILKEQKIIS